METVIHFSFKILIFSYISIHSSSLKGDQYIQNDCDHLAL